MKALAIGFMTIIISLSCHAQTKYVDGKYEGRSQSIYKDEPFVGISTLIIKENKIESVAFYIIDTTKNELFDAKYENHYKGVNEEYVLQCKNDWAGVNRYPKVLVAKQSLEKVDAVSGATWSHNLFKDASKKALKKAEKK